MTTAFFAQTTSQSSGQRPFRSRFEPCMQLSDGALDFPVTRVDPLFEEISAGPGQIESPTEWLLLCLRKLAQSARQFDVGVRPLHVPMPLSILQDPEAPERAARIAETEDFCTQEFILEFQDATLAATEDGVLDRMEAFRRKGFRIALDARLSSAAPFGARLRSAVERLRVTEFDLLNDETVQMRADIVSCLGGKVIIDRARGTNADLLRSFGATHALKLLADA